MSAAEWVFAVALAACVYVYAGYPALLAILARARPRPVHWAGVRPSVTVVIPAYNEEAVIADKIRNTLANGYPEELLEIIVASDGSTDHTNELVRRFEDRNLRLLALPRRGKLPALNAAVSAATGEILVFTDADVVLEPGALARLIGNFADPEVGGVTGRKAHVEGSGAGAIGRGESLYARFDEWQKHLESRIGSTVASHGALHAVRRDLYVPIRDASGADDMAISMRVVLQGRRLVYEPDAVARVDAPADLRAEFVRKVRIANQVMHALLGLKGALWTSGFYSVELISHKLLRYWVPVFLILLLGANAVLALAGHGAWQFVLVVQLGFYAAAAITLLLPHRRPGGAPRLLAVPYYFCAVNAVAFMALLSLARGRRSGTWAPGGGFARGPGLGRESRTEVTP
jgi:cellulose synthase/poly-beta-1,6-N-acetylglucosamine synthase-like glycosyltransferase